MDETTVLYPHLEIDTSGEARLTRLPRIRVSMIAADYLGHGWSADQIAEQYPHLQLAEIHAALTYYFDHKDSIDAQLRTELKECSDRQANPLALKLAKAKPSRENGLSDS